VDDERPFRLRPPRPRHVRDEAKVWARGFRQLMHLVRMTTKPLAARLGRGSRNYRMGGIQAPRHNQRCAVSLAYTRNKIRGQWAAHGRYIVRDSATALRPDGTAAFGSKPDPVNIAETLAAWQKVGDERLFKIVLSPEFGEQVDLERLTRNVMSAIEGDVGRPHPAVRQKVHIGTFCPPSHYAVHTSVMSISKPACAPTLYVPLSSIPEGILVRCC
jgi:hypothetical protein